MKTRTTRNLCAECYEREAKKGDIKNLMVDIHYVFKSAMPPPKCIRKCHKCGKRRRVAGWYREETT